MITTNENFDLAEVKERLAKYTTGDVVSKVTCREKISVAGRRKARGASGSGGEEQHREIPESAGMRSDDLSGPHAGGGDSGRGAGRHYAQSNGPGDPKECADIIEELKKLYASDVPIFAICLGHQLMALANGADTHKMKYGHRGGNHPVKDLETGRVYISSQNHGYVVDAENLDPSVAVPAFVNVNDGTNEGLTYTGKNIFTVQFHPEACPGPQDTGYLFDRFMEMMGGSKIMPKNKDIKKVLVIGSGPIVIGQAAEFDYAGTQACRSLKEEGIEVVLVNSNPATIMTDKDIADEVYIEPLTVEGAGADHLSRKSRTASFPPWADRPG